MINVPNILTLGNLFCGCLAIVSLYQNRPEYVLAFFIASLVFDFLDGLAARALKQTGPLGAELDSLADMVSFGVLPGMLLYWLMGEQEGISVLTGGIAFVYTCAAALRLAKFNLDERQTKDFLGLNTPSAAIAIIGLYWIDVQGDCSTSIAELLDNRAVLVAITLFLSIVLLVDLPMLSFKPDLKDRKRTLSQVWLILGGIILFISLGTCAIPFLILWYTIYSIIRFVVNKNHP